MAADKIKKRKDRMPRKVKKALKDMRCWPETGVIFRLHAYRPYPRTKWVVEAERQFRRLIKEYNDKNEKIKALEKNLEMINCFLNNEKKIFTT